MKRTRSIPDPVLDKITQHRPHLLPLVDNLRRLPSLAAQLEKAIADGYLFGETRLTGAETFALASCCAGRPYGGSMVYAA
jgi:hypothetical protein